jgi:hypothetical protein
MIFKLDFEKNPSIVTPILAGNKKGRLRLKKNAQESSATTSPSKLGHRVSFIDTDNGNSPK